MREILTDRILVLLDLFYQLVSFAPFADYLHASPGKSADASRPARNLSEVSRMISQYGFLHDMHSLTAENRIALPEEFFNSFLKAHYLDGVGEYEDNADFAPDGCVSFMTIHQSKGLEFPVVIVGVPGRAPKEEQGSADAYCRGKIFPQETV